MIFFFHDANTFDRSEQLMLDRCRLSILCNIQSTIRMATLFAIDHDVRRQIVQWLNILFGHLTIDNSILFDKKFLLFMMRFDRPRVRSVCCYATIEYKFSMNGCQNSPFIKSVHTLSQSKT